MQLPFQDLTSLWLVTLLIKVYELRKTWSKSLYEILEPNL